MRAAFQAGYTFSRIAELPPTCNKQALREMICCCLTHNSNCLGQSKQPIQLFVCFKHQQHLPFELPFTMNHYRTGMYYNLSTGHAWVLAPCRQALSHTQRKQIT